jgi:excisionase family DNA binding protein
MNSSELAALLLLADDPAVARDLRAVLARHSAGSRLPTSSEPTLDLMPLKEWARLVGSSAQTVRRWIRRGQVPGARLLPGRGGNYLIPRDAMPPVTQAVKPVDPPSPLANLSYTQVRSRHRFRDQ